MYNTFSIENKIIIITGGSRGIGFYLATELSKQGAIVYALSRTLPKNNKKDANLNFIKCDITNKKKFQLICRNIIKKNSRIDVLVNNAGISSPSNSEIYDEKDWLKTIQTNLTSSFTCSQIVLPYMKKQKQGSIINVTSINSILAFPNNPAYIASKGGTRMLTKSLAKDWGKYGIRVNNLAPGYFITDMNKKTYSNKKTRVSRAEKTMLKRWGKLSDLLGPCLFLASDASEYVTGTDLFVDGGWISNGL
tara:strand:+ start:5202 stop:5948 length:747 start_codon:yes stop_codon:yes gene_type:complete